MHFPHSNYFPISLSKYSLSSTSLFKLLLPRPALQFLVSAMAGTPETFSSDTSTMAVAADDDAVKFGFQRSEMFKENLSGTVDPYDRHVFLCYKTHESWPPRVEASDSDPLPKLLSDALKNRKNDITVKTRLTICEGGDGTELSDGDVLIFPEMIKYRGLTDPDVDTFVEDVLVNGKPWASGMKEVLNGSHVFVCAHNTRDRRCGVCGPVLIEKFKEEIELKGLKDQVFVSACSHVGGHKYAGNLIIFSADSNGKVSGDWYGYVVPSDVTELLDQHIGKGQIIERIWRGQMSAHVEETENVDELKLPNGNHLKNDSEKDPVSQESNKETKATAESCCQGANGISCCRDGSFDEYQAPKKAVTSCCQDGNGISCCSNEVLEEEPRKALGKLTSFIGKWEQHEVLAAAGVIGAVATVAVAYSLYKRSS